LRRWIERQILAKIDDQEPVGPASHEIAQDECIVSEHGPVHPAVDLSAKGRVRAAQANEITVQRILRRMHLALGKVELAALKGLPVTWVGDDRAAFRSRETAKLLQELHTAGPNQLAQFGMMVGEIQKRARCREFLALKKQRRAGREQKQCR